MSHKENDKFEEYLKEVHAEQYHGNDDDMPDNFDNWLSNLEVDEFIALGNRAMVTAQEQERQIWIKVSDTVSQN